MQTRHTGDDLYHQFPEAKARIGSNIIHGKDCVVLNNTKVNETKLTIYSMAVNLAL